MVELLVPSARLQAAVLGRALKRVEGTIERKDPELPPGSVAVDLELRVQGDIIVEQGSKPGPGKEQITVKAEQLISALALALGPEEFEARLNEAYSHLAACSKGRKADRDNAAATIASGAAVANSLMLPLARHHKLVEVKTPSRKRGAVKGDPKVTGRISASGNEVEIDIE